MADLIKAPINYAVSAGGQFVKGGSVVFGFINIRPDAANPATLKPIYLDSALTSQAANPQGLSSDAVFNQSLNGVLFGADDDSYSVIIYDANDVELSYIPVYNLSDATAAANAQAAEAGAIVAQDLAEVAQLAAEVAQAAAEAAALSAGISLSEFVNRYLGSYVSDPTLDPAGSPPQEGSLYWNSAGTPRFKVFTSGAWVYPLDLALGSAAYADLGTAADQIPTNADLDGKNLLINGGFDIWQRGDSLPAIPNPAFGPDRLRFGHVGSTITLTKTNVDGTDDRGIIYTNKAAARIDITTKGTYIDISQKLEPIADWYGKEITFSYLMRQQIGTGAQIGSVRVRHFDGITIEGSVSFGLSTPITDTNLVWQEFTFTMPEYTGSGTVEWTEVAFILDMATIDDGDRLQLISYKLEEGSVATNFSTQGASIGEELALCEDFYREIPISSGYKLGSTGSGFYELAYLNFPTMRSIPSADIGGVSYENCTFTDDVVSDNTYTIRGAIAGANTRFRLAGTVKLDSEL